MSWLRRLIHGRCDETLAATVGLNTQATRLLCATMLREFTENRAKEVPSIGPSRRAVLLALANEMAGEQSEASRAIVDFKRDFGLHKEFFQYQEKTSKTS